MGKAMDAMQLLFDTPQALFEKVRAGTMSPKEFRKRTNGKWNIRSGGKRDNSKWSMNELRAIRARNGVGRPPAVNRARAEAAAAKAAQ